MWENESKGMEATNTNTVHLLVDCDCSSLYYNNVPSFNLSFNAFSFCKMLLSDRQYEFRSYLNC